MKKQFLLFYGLLETFLFSGSILGWSSLQSMLLKIEIYADECPSINASNSTETICLRQQQLLNLAFTIGSFCLGITAILWGFLLDRLGIRIVRLILNILLSSGAVLLSLTSKNTSYLLFPSIILTCLAGVPLRLVNLQISELFPAYRSTIITLYSGAFGASSAVYTLLQFAFDAGLSWEWTCSVLIWFTLVMLPVTLFLFPSKHFQTTTEDRILFDVGSKKYCDVANVIPIIMGTYQRVEDKLESDAVAKENNSNDKTNEDPKKNGVPALQFPPETMSSIPLLKSLCSLSYMLHQYWFSWILFYTIFYVGTLRLWTLQALGHPKDSDYFSSVYNLLQILGIFLAPLGGAFMDWRISEAAKVLDPKDRRLNIIQSNFWPLVVTTLTAVVPQIAQFFNSPAAIWVSMIFVTICRILILSVATAYLRIRFPADHFNRLLGIMSTCSAIFSLLQFPLFMWATKDPERTFTQVNIFNSVCLFLAWVHPSLIPIKPLQTYLVRNEMFSSQRN